MSPTLPETTLQTFTVNLFNLAALYLYFMFFLDYSKGITLSTRYNEATNIGTKLGC